LSALFVPTFLTSPPTEVWVLKTALSTPLKIREGEEEEQAEKRTSKNDKKKKKEREDFLKDIPQEVEPFEIPTPPRKAYSSSPSSSSSSKTRHSEEHLKEKRKEKAKQHGRQKDASSHSIASYPSSSTSSPTSFQVDLRGSITLFNDEPGGVSSLKSEFSSIEPEIIDDVLVNFSGDIELARTVLKEMVEDEMFYSSSSSPSSSSSSTLTSSSSDPSVALLKKRKEKKRKTKADVDNEKNRRRSELYQETLAKLQSELEKMKLSHGEELENMATIAGSC
jgi:hypothetical protein